MNDHIETVFIEIKHDIFNSSKNIIIGTIYRPPNTNINIFLENLVEILLCIKTENKFIYLLGDFNLNLLNANTHQLTSDFLDTLYSFSFIPTINKPTRVKKESATLIDNIFCNYLSNNTHFSGILYTDVSDHFPVFYISKNTKQDVTIPQYICRRQYSEINKTKFSNKLQELNWNEILSQDQCQDAYSLFHNVFTKLYYDCFPMQKIKLNYRNRKLWLTHGLKKSIKTKNKLYVKSIKTPTLHNIKVYKEYRNKLNSLLRKTERLHYDQLFVKNKNNLKKSWAIIKQVINKRKNQIVFSKFKINNNIVTDEKIIANNFNKYFVNLGPSLAQRFHFIRQTQLLIIVAVYQPQL